MPRVAFRLDDVTPEMDWERFAAFERLFKRAGLRPLLGIVPRNQDENLVREPAREDFWEQMRALADSGWRVAQHGFEHRYETRDGGVLGLNRQSEFASLAYSVQDAKIRRGRELLAAQGLATNIFMPPAHSYDRTTLRALSDNGFTTITDGYTPFVYKAHGLKFIPCQFGSPRKLPLGVSTICIHANTTTPALFDAIASFVEHERRFLVDFAALEAAHPVPVIGPPVEQLVLRLRRGLRHARSGAHLNALA